MLRLVLNLLINSSNNDIRIFLTFDENGKNSDLFNLMNNEMFINNIVEYLYDSNSKITIISNKVKTIRNSDFFLKLNNMDLIQDRVFIRSIESKTFANLKKKGLDTEFVISEPSTILFGDFDKISMSKDNPPFVNFNSESFFNVLLRFFNMVVSLKMEQTGD
ncbi:hypothetical protein AYY27_08115 [Photobacterium damselae]|nr:hypothetical protein AYY27_08115 [Photobacterium damselae]